MVRDHQRFTRTYCFHLHENKRTIFLGDVGNLCPQSTLPNLKSEYVAEQSVGIMTGWTAAVRFPAWQNFSLLHSVHIGSVANPVDYGALSPGVKAARE
jgi:hypothetical protein